MKTYRKFDGTNMTDSVEMIDEGRLRIELNRSLCVSGVAKRAFPDEQYFL